MKILPQIALFVLLTGCESKGVQTQRTPATADAGPGRGVPAFSTKDVSNSGPATLEMVESSGVAKAVVHQGGPANNVGGEFDHDSMDRLKEVFRVINKRVMACEEMPSCPVLSGTIVRLVVSIDGKPEQIVIENRKDGFSAKFRTCMYSAYESARYPKPKGGPVTISYPCIILCTD